MGPHHEYDNCQGGSHTITNLEWVIASPHLDYSSSQGHGFKSRVSR